MGRKVPALVALIGCLLAAQRANAQFEADFGDAPFEITADTIDYERDRDVYVARGNVQLLQEKQSLRADWVSFSRSGGRGVASGNVAFSDGTETVYANFVEFNLDTLQGVLFLARFDDSTNRFKMEGDEIVKTGDQTYTFEGGVFTTCRCPDEGRDPWQIRAQSADLDFDSYAIARNTTVNILGVPVLWFPWMAYPLSTERETGFLFPEFSFFSRDGVRIGTPFFWAALPNVNATLTPRWLEKRGVKGEVDLEYLLGKRSSGSLFGAYIYDTSVDPNSADTPFDASRWIARGQQDFYLPFGWRAKSDFAFVSDNNYPIDFRDLRAKGRDRFLESNAFVFNEFGASDQYGIVASVQVADDLQSPDNVDRDPYLLQRVPHIELRALPQPLPFEASVARHIVPSLDVQYTYFGQLQDPDEIFGDSPIRSDAPQPPNGDVQFYDVGIDALPDGLEGGPGDVHQDDAPGGPEGDGIFEEGEPLADRGHRLRLSPRIAAPFRIGKYVEFYPEVGYEHSFYDTREQGATGWGSFTGRLDARTRLRREYGTNVVHLLEPQISYALVKHPDIGDEPLFSPYTAVPQERIRQLYLENVTRDSSDRPPEFNGFTVGLGNRFYREGKGDRPARMLADFNVGVLFDFENGGRFGTFVIDGYGNPVPGVELRLGFDLDPDGFVVEEVLAEGRWQGEKVGFGLRYRYLDRVPQFFEDFQTDPDRFDDFDNNFNRINQIDWSASYRITRGWSARYRVAYSFENSLLLQNAAAIEYLSRCNCWAAGVEVSQNRQFGFQFNLIYRIVGLGRDATGLTGGGLGDFGLAGGF